MTTSLSKQTVSKQTLKFNLCLLIFLFFFTICFTVPNLLFLHFDLGWHIFTGDLIRSTGEVPQQELWSSTAKGYRWLNYYWLWEVFASAIYELTGDFSGLFIFVAIQSGLTCALITWHLLTRECSFLATSAVSLLFGCTWFIANSLNPSVTLSPKTLNWLFFAGLHLLLFLISERNRSRITWLIPLLIGLWGNIHGLAAPAITLIGSFCLQSILQTKWRTSLHLGASILAGYLLLTLAHPLHLEFWKLVISSAGDPATAFNTGNEAFDVHNSPGVVYLVVFVVVMIVGRPKVLIADAITTLFWLIIGLTVNKAFPLFMLCSAPMLATGLDRLGSRFSSYQSRMRNPKRVFMRGIFAIPLINTQTLSSNFKRVISKAGSIFKPLEQLFGLARTTALLLPISIFVLILSPYYLSNKYPRGFDYPNSLYPKDAFNYLLKNHGEQKILTDWNYGGFIIHKTKGSFPIFVDGRSAGAYPTQILLDYRKLDTEPEIILNKYEIEVTFLRKQVPANTILKKSEQWRHRYSDSLVSIYEHKP